MTLPDAAVLDETPEVAEQVGASEKSSTHLSAEQAMEMYRMMVDTVTANEQRRQQISSVFIALLVAGFGAAGAIESFNLVYATVPALALSVVWFGQVRYLKRLAKAKFHVIDELEHIPPYQPFAVEWKFLKRDAKKRKWYDPGLSELEMIVPAFVFFASIAHLVLLWLGLLPSGTEATTIAKVWLI